MRKILGRDRSGCPKVLGLFRGFVVAISLATAVFCYGSYRNDQAYLRRIARQVTLKVADPSEEVVALLHWVYRNGGSARNRDYFLFSALRATPVQVVRGGGDCADKSRLLSALLREVGIASTAAMCFDATTNAPVHTVVEVWPTSSTRMLVDPAYDLYFPTRSGTGYYDLLDIRRDPQIVSRRVQTLQREKGGKNPAAVYYLASSSPYHTASTFNWWKNSLTRFLQDRLYAWYGLDMYVIARPLFLEEPKLAVACLFLLVGVGSVAAIQVVRSRRRFSVFFGGRFRADPVPKVGLAGAGKQSLR